MKWHVIFPVLLFLCCQSFALASSDLTSLKKDQIQSDFRVQHLYSDSEGRITGAKFLHVPTGAPVFLLQLESVPQLLTWVDSPADSNRGLPHSLEHLLLGKGAKGRYVNLLREMRLSDGSAATSLDYVYYGLASGAGVDGFFEQFHALLDALYRPDFSDIEAEREFYHFSVVDAGEGKKTLIEGGTVYNEMLSGEGRYSYFFELNKRVLGEQNPLGLDSRGVPDEMRTVTPGEIRRFHDQHYQIGPGTGFIFSFSPHENVSDLLLRIAQELRPFSTRAVTSEKSTTTGPKYPIHPSDNLAPAIFPYPATDEAAPGSVSLAWPPARETSSLDLKMLKLFAHALAGGEGSLLHKGIVDSQTRAFESGATAVDFEILLSNSPLFPLVILDISGVPGNRISTDSIGQLRSIVLSRIRDVSQYPDQSGQLLKFNESVASYAKGLRRSDGVWTKNPPGFDAYPPKTDWKDYLDSLETDSSFVRSLSQDRDWLAIDAHLKSGKNVWRDLIESFHLLETPYVAAGTPSPKLLAEVEKKKQERIKDKIAALIEQYHTNNDQEALSRFEAAELIKTKEIEQIDARVARPLFTDHPPMTPDDSVKLQQFQIDGVPVIASIFDSPPTIDVGLSFDLSKVPVRYYKYLSLLPKCLDSLGLKKPTGQVVPYPELVGRIQRDVFAFSTGFETNPVSHRADFTIRASAANLQEFRGALDLIQQLMTSNDLDLSNVDRLRDIVASRIADDNSFAQQDASIVNSGYAYRYQTDLLYLALNSRFTSAHWDSRLRWLLHHPASSQEIDALHAFANKVLSSSSGMSRQQLSQTLDGLNVQGLEKELVEYWKGNLGSFPEAEVGDGLGQLTAEVMEDLRTGPAEAIKDIRDLQKIVLNRRALRIDLTLSQSALEGVQQNLARLVKSIPSLPFNKEAGLSDGVSSPSQRLEKRYRSSVAHWPLYVGFVNPYLTGGNVIFSADFPDYSKVDRQSLLQVLASSLFAGVGPQSFQIKAFARGLAYRNSLSSYPAVKRIWYYADRSPDLASLLKFLNETAAMASDLRDASLVDYAYSYTFTFSRAGATFSERGKAAAQDIRDGNEPVKVRRFSEAVLKLRKDPDLLPELTHHGLTSICGVLARDDCKQQQYADKSLFFFVGSEQVLSDVEKRVAMPKLFRLYPSDFWLDLSDVSNRRPSN